MCKAAYPRPHTVSRRAWIPEPESGPTASTEELPGWEGLACMSQSGCWLSPRPPCPPKLCVQHKCPVTGIHIPAQKNGPPVCSQSPYPQRCPETHPGVFCPEGDATLPQQAVQLLLAVGADLLKLAGALLEQPYQGTAIACKRRRANGRALLPAT